MTAIEKITSHLKEKHEAPYTKAKIKAFIKRFPDAENATQSEIDALADEIHKALK